MHNRVRDFDTELDEMDEQNDERRLVFELIDQRPSNYFTDEDPETGERRTPITTCTRRLLSHSAIELWEDGRWKLKKTRYIKGCDEYLVELQDAQGFKPNPIQDQIWLVMGKIGVTEAGIELGMFRYLTEGYNGNRDMKVEKGKIRRPRNAQNVISQVDVISEAYDTEAVADVKFEVQKYLQSLKSKEAGKTYYNEDAIEFLCSLFRLPAYESGYKSEAWVALSELSEEKPEEFLRTIQSKRALIEADVKSAYDRGIMAIDENRAALAEPYKLIKEFAKGVSTTGERLDLVIDFFSNPENAMYYDTLRTQLRSSMGEAVKKID